MAKLTDLSNELILAIRSHLEKPADILALTVANRRLYSLVLPLLYEKINLDIRARPQFGQDDKGYYAGFNFHHIPLALLARTLLDPRLLCAGSAVTSLFLTVEYNMLSTDCCEVLGLLPQLNHLAKLSIAITGDECVCLTVISTQSIIASLSSAKNTLMSLAISVEDEHNDADWIGSLREFIALRHLCIQAHVLLGAPGSPTDFRRSSNFNNEHVQVSELLPASLETLQLHCSPDGREIGETEMVELTRQGLVISCPLEAITKEHKAVRNRVLEKLVLCGRKERNHLQFLSEELKLLLDVVGTSLPSLASSRASTHMGLDKDDHRAAIYII